MAAAVEGQKQLFVRIGFQGDHKSLKQVPRTRLVPSNINKIFNCDIEFLMEEDEVRRTLNAARSGA